VREVDRRRVRNRIKPRREGCTAVEVGDEETEKKVREKRHEKMETTS
jgi:hypothetical protein